MPSAPIPVLRYADAPAAIDFLCAAFGFARHAVHADPSDPTRIFHAELTLGGGVIMLSSAIPTPFADAAPMLLPAAAGGVTGAIYMVVDDVEAHAAAAQAAGADIFMPPEDRGEGGHSYAVRDPEGHCWSFGDYDPFA